MWISCKAWQMQQERLYMLESQLENLKDVVYGEKPRYGERIIGLIKKFELLEKYLKVRVNVTMEKTEYVTTTSKSKKETKPPTKTST